MIEFNGNPDGKCKHFLLKKQIFLNVLFMSYIMAIMSAVIISLVITLQLYIALWGLLAFAVLFVISMLPPSKESQKTFMPDLVFIDLKDEVIVHKNEKREQFHMLSSVKTVIDYGEWYYFVFNFGDRDPYFVCQKSLLTKGTLEEFEALFEDKIERRIK